MSKKEVYYPDKPLFNWIVGWGGTREKNDAPKNLEKLVKDLSNREDISQEILSSEDILDYELWYASHTHHIWSEGNYFDIFDIGKFYKEIDGGCCCGEKECTTEVVKGFSSKLSLGYVNNSERVEMSVSYDGPGETPNLEEYKTNLKKRLSECANNPKRSRKIIKLKKSEILEIIETAIKEKDFMKCLLKE